MKSEVVSEVVSVVPSALFEEEAVLSSDQVALGYYLDKLSCYKYKCHLPLQVCHQ